jgi:hypothetical protein
MGDVVSIQSRRFVARSRAGAERRVSARRDGGAFLGRHTVAAIPLQAIDHPHVRDGYFGLQ